MVLAGLAPRFLRRRFRIALGERRRLALPAPADLLDQLLQLLDPLCLNEDNAP
jgi:hypothetical protein